jgi:hypothetical protein
MRSSPKFACWVIAMACWLVAPVVFAEEPKSPGRPLSAEAAFENLKTNAPAAWLVRMTTYDPNEPALRIDATSALGAASEDFTFVADWSELQGYTVSEAVRKMGGDLPPGYHVSAVVFPIAHHTIFPASVRGMLQVVQQIDMRRSAEPGYRAAPLDVLLTGAERKNLAAVGLESWAWNNYRDHFTGFAQALAALRARGASAIAHVGDFGNAWCEPGCARIVKPQSADEENKMSLDLPGGKTFAIENFGVRVFLVRNQPIERLAGHVLLDFDDPANQRVPLDLPAAAAPADDSPQR